MADDPAHRRSVRVRAPELVGRGGWLNTGGQTSRSRASREDRAARLLDLLLHQLPARPRRAAPARGRLRRRPGDHRRALPEVRPRGRARGASSPPSSATPCTTRCSTTPTSRPGRRTPSAPGRRWRSSTPRATSSPSCPVRVTRTGSRVLLDELVAEHEAKGTLHRGDGPYVAPEPEPTTLRFPAKAVRLPNGTLLVADAGHHQLVELEADLETRGAAHRVGRAGLVDGAAGSARFDEPNGLCLLPAEVAAQVGYDVVVADTVNHALRGVRLADGEVTTVAGTGAAVDARRLAMLAERALLARGTWPGRRLGRGRRSRWPGIHQLWSFDPVDRRPERAGRDHQRGAARRTARRGVARAAVGPGGRPTRRGPAVVRGLRDVVACASLANGRRHDPRRQRALRLRPRRRRGRGRDAAAPARRHGAARRERRGRATPTTARSAATTRSRATVTTLAMACASRPAPCSTAAPSSSSSRRRTG